MLKLTIYKPFHIIIIIMTGLLYICAIFIKILSSEITKTLTKILRRLIMKHLKSTVYGLSFLALLQSTASYAAPVQGCIKKPLPTAQAYSDGGYAWLILGKFGTPADNSKKLNQSLIHIFENNVEISPAHSRHADIRSLGKGRFSHYSNVDGTGESIRLSASDNSNVKTNQKTYSYCIVDPSVQSGPGTTTKVPSVPLGTGAVFYVSPSGNDANPGTLAAPWKTLRKAANTLTAGQTVYLRGGVYDAYFAINNSGTATNRISFVAYNGEVPIIDGSSKKTDPNNAAVYANNAININGSYVTLRGIEVRNSAATGIRVNGNYVAIDQVHSHNNYFAGVYFYMASYGSVTNSIIHDSYDYGVGGVGGGGNADCLGSSASNTPTTVYGYHTFDNNLVYNCSDDGIDTWTSQYNTIKHNIVHHVGYSNASNGGSVTTGLPAGNGHGYKLGKGGNNTVTNNIAYSNRVSGFDDNSGPANKLYNNTAFGNGVGFLFWTFPSAILKNNLSYNNANNITSGITQSNNSWNLSITDPLLISQNPSEPTFLMPSSGSPVIDKGVDVGMPYQGAAPDLGAFEQQ